MNNQLQVISQKEVVFYDDTITAVQVADGTVYIPIRPICVQLGLNWNGQRERINRDPILSESKQGVRVTRPPEEGGEQEMICLPLDMMHGWLFGINANRVKDQIRESLLRFQREAYRVLAEAFNENKLTHRPNSDLDELLQNETDPAVVAYKTAMAVADLARAHLLMRADIETNANNIEALQREVALIHAELGSAERYITQSQAMQVSQAVKGVALSLGANTGRNEFGGVYGELYRRLEVTSYKQIPAAKYDEAMQFLRDWWQTLTDSEDVPF